MLRFFVFISVLILFVNCKKELDSNFFKYAVPKLPKELQCSYTLRLLDSVSLINTDTMCFRSSIKFFYNDSLLYYTYDNKIIKYNVKNVSADEVRLPIKIKGFISAIHIVSLDSLYILQSMPPKLVFVNNTKGEYSITNLPKINFKTNNDFFNTRSAILDYNTSNYNLDFNNLKFDKKSNRVQIGVTPYDANLLEGFEKTNRIGVFDIELNRWIKTYASPKGVYGFRGAFTFGKNRLSSKNILFKGDSTLVAYPVNHTVQLYINKQFSKNINFTSRHSKSIKKPLQLKESGKIEVNKKLLTSTAHYSEIFYHKQLKVYSRIYLDEQESFDDKRLYKSNLERDKYVVFLDEQFNYAGEFKLPNNYNFILNTTNGFYIFTNNYKNRLDYKIIKK